MNSDLASLLQTAIRNTSIENSMINFIEIPSVTQARWLRSRRLGHKGATAVEFALVTPILLTMLFICFEFTRLCMMTNLAQDAAYEAARYAMVEGSTSQDAIDKANQVLSRLGARNASVVVNDGEELTDETELVTVKVIIPMADNSFVLSHFTTNHQVTAEISLIAERYNGFYGTE